MSTTYYRLRPPITSVRPEVGGGHTHVGVWVNHAKSGTLVVRNEEWPALLKLFTDDVEVCRTRYGGEPGRMDIDASPEVMHHSANDSMQLVDEYGQLTTLGEVFERAGWK